MSTGPSAALRPRERLRALHRIWAERRDAPTTSERLYLIYLTVMTAAILGGPAAYWTIGLLADPSLRPLVTHPATVPVLLAAPLLGAAVLANMGAMRGPALLTPYLTGTLVHSDLPRGAVLRRPLLRSGALLAVALVLACGLPAAALVRIGAATWQVVAVVEILAVGLSGPFLLAWLAGELLGAWPRRILVASLVLWGALVALAAVATGLRTVPIGWLGSLAVSVLLLMGALAAALALLPRVHGSTLVAQARHAEAIADQLATGDMSGAAMTAAQRPSTARRIRATHGRGLGLYLSRDALAWLRTPERTVGAVVQLVVGGAAVGAAGSVTGPPSWLLLVGGALLLVGGTSPLVDGARHAVRTAGSPVLFGHGTGGQLLRHIPAPASAAIVLTGAGAAGAVCLGAPTTALAPALLVAMVAVGLRICDTAKGPMPVELLTPIPTAQGDFSAVLQMMWQLDLQLRMVVIAAALVAAPRLVPDYGTAVAVMTAGVSLLSITYATRKRLRGLRGG